jgi:hypothetical protein
MPVTMEYVENGRVLLYTFTDPWDAQDLMGFYAETRAYLDKAEHKVHTLVDVRNARRVPTRVMDLRRGPDWSHPNSGHVAVVGAATAISIFVQAVFRISRFDRVQFFNTMDEAWTYLRKLIAAEEAGVNDNPNAR